MMAVQAAAGFVIRRGTANSSSVHIDYRYTGAAFFASRIYCKTICDRTSIDKGVFYHDPIQPIYVDARGTVMAALPAASAMFSPGMATDRHTILSRLAREPVAAEIRKWRSVRAGDYFDPDRAISRGAER
jgi:hypothetical protein